jgi:RHS repeat-associated protein
METALATENSHLEMDAGLAENSRLGLRAVLAGMYPAVDEVKPNIASGIEAEIRREGIRSRCTGKQRDQETGLDFFGARYMSAAQGRFTSADPLPGWQSDPQSWNAYAYGRNNPLVYTDPDGQRYRICAQDTPCTDVSDDEFAQLRQNPGAGIGLWNGDIHAFVNGQWQNAGTYWQTDVDLPFDVSMALRAAGQTADRELKSAIKDVGYSVAGGLALSAASVAITKLTTIGLENLPLLRQISKVVSKGNLNHIVNEGHLAEFQRLAPGTTLDDVVNVGIEVAQTGRQIKPNVFIRSMQIGGEWVTVRVFVNSNNAIRTVYIVK